MTDKPSRRSVQIIWTWSEVDVWNGNLSTVWFFFSFFFMKTKCLSVQLRAIFSQFLSAFHAHSLILTMRTHMHRVRAQVDTHRDTCTCVYTNIHYIENQTESVPPPKPMSLEENNLAAPSSPKNVLNSVGQLILRRGLQLLGGGSAITPQGALEAIIPPCKWNESPNAIKHTQIILPTYFTKSPHLCLENHINLIYCTYAHTKQFS